MARPFVSYFDSLSHETLIDKCRRQLHGYVCRYRGKPRLINGVYVLGYHSIVAGDHRAPWEAAYSRVSTREEDFYEQIDFMLAQAKPLRISEVPGILKAGRPDRPYFAVTFDDGYKNILKVSQKVLAKGIVPSAFINPAFVSQQQVYYRVLLYELAAAGALERYRDMIADFLGVDAAQDPVAGFKNQYRYRETEAFIEARFRETFGKLPADVHLNWDDVRALQRAGWEIGNHTVSHPTLSRLTYAQQDAEIMDVVTACEREGVECLPWLNYPNGTLRDMNGDTGHWMEAHPAWHGTVVFPAVNVMYSQAEIMRIGVSIGGMKEFKRLLHLSHYYTGRLLRFISKRGECVA
ncbi:MAG: polysaccharide deacetylase family protein [Candidatus Omnitrophota bacterium]